MVMSPVETLQSARNSPLPVAARCADTASATGTRPGAAHVRPPSGDRAVHMVLLRGSYQATFTFPASSAAPASRRSSAVSSLAYSDSRTSPGADQRAGPAA
jgi:hypothetical protein